MRTELSLVVCLIFCGLSEAKEDAEMVTQSSEERMDSIGPAIAAIKMNLRQLAEGKRSEDEAMQGVAASLILIERAGESIECLEVVSGIQNSALAAMKVPKQFMYDRERELFLRDLATGGVDSKRLRLLSVWSDIAAASVKGRLSKSGGEGK